MRKLIPTSMIAFALLFSACADDNTYDADELDTDTGILDEPMTTPSDGLYGQWDYDADTQISEDEYGRGVFSELDTDQSGYLDENEFTSGTDYFEGDAGLFGDWDADADDQITEDDFTTRYGQYSAFQRYDLDQNGFLDQNEFMTFQNERGLGATPDGLGTTPGTTTPGATDGGMDSGMDSGMDGGTDMPEGADTPDSDL